MNYRHACAIAGKQLTHLLLKIRPHRMRFAVLSSNLLPPVAGDVPSGDYDPPLFVSLEHVFGVLEGPEFEVFEVVFGVDDWTDLAA